MTRSAWTPKARRSRTSRRKVASLKKEDRIPSIWANSRIVAQPESAGLNRHVVGLQKPYRKGGMPQKELEFATDPSSPDYSAMYAAEFTALLGEKDLAFRRLEQAYHERKQIVYLKVSSQEKEDGC
jgi:hypothetical protein